MSPRPLLLQSTALHSHQKTSAPLKLHDSEVSTGANVPKRPLKRVQARVCTCSGAGVAARDWTRLFVDGGDWVPHSPLALQHLAPKTKLSLKVHPGECHTTGKSSERPSKRVPDRLRRCSGREATGRSVQPTLQLGADRRSPCREKRHVGGGREPRDGGKRRTQQKRGAARRRSRRNRVGDRRAARHRRGASTSTPTARFT